MADAVRRASPVDSEVMSAREFPANGHVCPKKHTLSIVLVHRVIQVIHKGIGICNIAPWLGDWGHGTTNLCGVERG
jgi:hypothetical protein